MKILHIEVRDIEPVVGMHSLVGVVNESYPMPFGNYFSFEAGPRCVNMWAENLEEWVKQNILVGKIKIEIVNGKHAIIVDECIPRDWLIPDGICLTGSPGINVNGLKYMLNKMGMTFHNKFLCGCEDEDEFPFIHRAVGFINNKRKETFRCGKCGREWEC